MPENRTPPAHSPNNTAVICARMEASGPGGAGNTVSPGPNHYERVAMADASARHDTRCVDCRIETLPTGDGFAEWYIVNDAIWESSGMSPGGGCLCIGCLEARIGRQLAAADFDDVLVNDLRISRGDKAWSWRTDRLIERPSAAVV